eukprot:scaffold22309_cov116-Isochrysis_galbana.AAC.7
MHPAKPLASLPTQPRPASSSLLGRVANRPPKARPIGPLRGPSLLLVSTVALHKILQGGRLTEEKMVDRLRAAPPT